MLAQQHILSSAAGSVEFAIIPVVACPNGKFGSACRAIAPDRLLLLVEILTKGERRPAKRK